MTSTAASSGEPPYFLQCLFCLWDSKQLGMTFEKPTGLSQQLQKTENTSPESAEFNRLQDHFEPFIKRNLAQSSISTARVQQHATTSTTIGGLSSTIMAATAALSSSSLLRDMGSSRYSGNNRSRSGFGTSASSFDKSLAGQRDELEPYDALFPYSMDNQSTDAKGKRVARQSRDWDRERIDAMRDLKDVEMIANVQQRWTNGWKQSVLANDLKPIRTPLQAKYSKRCPSCKHILTKPEQKASSTRFKIKLVAQNYLPSVQIARRILASTGQVGSRLSAIAAASSIPARADRRSSIATAGGGGAADTSGKLVTKAPDDEPLRPGRTYTFELTFTNPLYEPIQVKLAVAKPKTDVRGKGVDGSVDEAGRSEPSFAVNLPSSTFEVSAYAEEWEYEQDFDAHDEDEDESDSRDDVTEVGRGTKRSRSGVSRHGLGVVEKKMNRTKIVMDVAVSKDAIGPLRANMLVTYFYASEDSVGNAPLSSPSKVGAQDDRKSFSFWTWFSLGTVVPRPAPPTSSSTATAGQGSSLSRTDGQRLTVR
ncbi:hypothetical protein OIO90_002182 [Microbotryomycetes sp. JL221]|nr:hypothetical protein OIO90_002182 [Microbotryomycetes sp. JL221]